MIAGQLDALELLEASATPAVPASEKLLRIPTGGRPDVYLDTAYPVHCTGCGKEQASWAEFNLNHNGHYSHDGRRICTSMDLTMNHIIHWVERICRFQEHGVQAYPCCWDKYDMHGDKVVRPTLAQLGEHLAKEIDRARDAWGIQRPALDQWLTETLAQGKVWHGALDPADYPELESPRFRYYNPANFDYGVPCGWCGKPGNPYHSWGGFSPAYGTTPRHAYAICKACDHRSQPPFSKSEYVS